MMTKEYREKNAEAIREYHRKWYLKNRDRVKDLTSKWAKENKDKKNTAAKRWRDKNKPYRQKKFKETYDPARQKRIWWLQRYGLTEDQFNLMLLQQKKRCAVCRDEFSDAIKPFVDHCHKTDVVRGLVCSRCNKAEGFLRNPDNARRMYEYMLKFELCYGGKN